MNLPRALLVAGQLVVLESPAAALADVTSPANIVPEPDEAAVYINR